jgi:hypothetical protein
VFDPFDFSDFGSPPATVSSDRPWPAGSRVALQPAIRETGLSTGFDPFTGDNAPRQTSPDTFSASAPGPDRRPAGARPSSPLFGFALSLAARAFGGAVAPASVGGFWQVGPQSNCWGSTPSSTLGPAPMRDALFRVETISLMRSVDPLVKKRPEHLDRLGGRHTRV